MQMLLFQAEVQTQLYGHSYIRRDTWIGVQHAELGMHMPED